MSDIYMILGSQNLPPAPVYETATAVQLTGDSIEFTLDDALNPPIEPKIRFVGLVDIESMVSDTIWEGIQNPEGSTVFWVVNNSDFTLTLRHERLAATDEARFALPSAVDYVLLQNSSVRLMWYSGRERWMIAG